MFNDSPLLNGGIIRRPAKVNGNGETSKTGLQIIIDEVKASMENWDEAHPSANDVDYDDSLRLCIMANIPTHPIASELIRLTTPEYSDIGGYLFFVIFGDVLEAMGGWRHVSA